MLKTVTTFGFETKTAGSVNVICKKKFSYTRYAKQELEQGWQGKTSIKLN